MNDWYKYFYSIAREQGNTRQAAREIASKMAAQFNDIPFIQ